MHQMSLYMFEYYRMIWFKMKFIWRQFTLNEKFFINICFNIRPPNNAPSLPCDTLNWHICFAQYSQYHFNTIAFHSWTCRFKPSLRAATHELGFGENWRCLCDLSLKCWIKTFDGFTWAQNPASSRAYSISY